MSLKTVILGMSMVVVAAFTFVGGSVDIGVPGWISFHQAEASPYRRSVRRTARRTARRTSYRHNHYYGGAAAVTVVAVGTIVATLPPACSTLVVNGVKYYNCSGTYYVPSGTQWVVVEAP